MLSMICVVQVISDTPIGDGGDTDDELPDDCVIVPTKSRRSNTPQATAAPVIDHPTTFKTLTRYD